MFFENYDAYKILPDKPNSRNISHLSSFFRFERTKENPPRGDTIFSVVHCINSLETLRLVKMALSTS